MTPLAILPKFLWKHIIAYLTYANKLQLPTVNSQFSAMIDWKALFLDDRPDAIVIVKCVSYYITNFWYYASNNHISCDGVSALLHFISSDNVDNSFIYYKVFIKSGEYLFANYNYNTEYNFCKRSCSIKITGSKTATTSFVYNSRCNNNLDTDIVYCRETIPIVISKYFSMSYIRFHNLKCLLMKYDFDTSCSDNTELSISNCDFNGDLCVLDITDVNKTNITNCQFNSQYGVGIYKTVYITENIIKCMISNSTFITKKDCIIGSIYDTITNILIQFTNNRVMKAKTVFAYFYDPNSKIIISNNSISNVDSFLRSCQNTIVINDNYFVNVAELRDNELGNIIIYDSDRFENCGAKCTEQATQLKIESMSQ